MLIHPVWRTFFQSPAPLIKVLDIREDVSNLTTYTFTAVNIPDLGSNRGVTDTNGTNPMLKSASNKNIIVFIHGEDAATAFSLSSCTLGDVAGSELTDRGGATNAINSGIYYWRSSVLDDIATTDIVVTWSEAVTGCAIGVCSAENVSFATANGGSVTGTGTLSMLPNPSPTALETFPTIIVASTLSAGAGAETFQLLQSTGTGAVSPMLLYEGSNAEFSYAAAYTYLPSWYGENISPITMDVSWSGATAGDATSALLV